MSQMIVVVEDEPEVGQLLSDLLADAGYDPVLVGDPGDVTRAIGGRPVGLFLIDVMLPRLSGIELAVRLQGSGTEVPMIGMSASPLMRDLAAQSHAFVDTIPKPFELDDLLDRIRQHLRTDMLE